MSISNGSTARKQTKPNIGKSFGSLAHDAIELGELQLKLIKLDSREAATRARSSLLLAVIGLALLMAGLPVALFAVAEALVQYADWSRVSALSASAAGAFILSVVLGLIGWMKLSQCLTTWQRSSQEFSRNVAWLKSALTGNINHPHSAPEASAGYDPATTRRSSADLK